MNPDPPGSPPFEAPYAAAQAVNDWYELFSRGSRDWLRHSEKIREAVREHLPQIVAGSDIIKRLNPPQRFPTVDTNVRRFNGAIHPLDVGGTELTPDEYYLLALSIDMGGQFFSRENKNP